MDRRSFVQASLSSLVTYKCSFARARAATRPRGCRLAVSGESFGYRLLGKHETHEGKLGDLWAIASSTTSTFGLRPGVCFFDDGKDPNALALPDVLLLPAGSYRGAGSYTLEGDHAGYSGPDGTVLMGIKLFDQIVKGNFTNPNPKPGTIGLRVHTVDDFCLPTIIAHELGHILQYKRGMSPEGPWQMEPHADFLAGWFLGHKKIHKGMPEYEKERVLSSFGARRIEKAIEAFFEIGDVAFNDPAHHGEPLLRATMVRAGYESSDLDVNQAFEKGKKFAGLK